MENNKPSMTKHDFIRLAYKHGYETKYDGRRKAMFVTARNNTVQSDIKVLTDVETQVNFKIIPI